MAEIPEQERALEREDASALARGSSLDDLQRMKAAEEVIELRHNRKKRSSRVTIASQVLVGYVALAGFFVNAFQSYNNKLQQQHQATIDQEKWNKEFERASQADKYRAFFETSVLATDPTNRDKRLVGYALLQEFVQDKDYNQKAAVMLEESLSQELRGNKKAGLDEEHRAAVVTILAALSETNDCRALERVAKSVDRLAKRHAQTGDVDEASEVFKIYVRRVVGRAAVVCASLKDFKAVRRPFRDTLSRTPELVDLSLKPPLASARSNELVALTLRDRCADETSTSGATDCPEILSKYAALCTKVDPK